MIRYFSKGSKLLLLGRNLFAWLVRVVRKHGEMREDCLAVRVAAKDCVAGVHVRRLLQHVELHGQHVRVHQVRLLLARLLRA